MRPRHCLALIVFALGGCRQEPPKPDPAPPAAPPRPTEAESLVHEVDDLTGAYGQADTPLDDILFSVPAAGDRVVAYPDDATWGRIAGPPGGRPAQELDREEYGRVIEDPFHRPVEDPLSTFSIDVDTASYSNVRRLLRAGRRPPVDAVRVEELLNYFSYGDRPPEGDEPFSVTTEIHPCPWQPAHRLVRIGLVGAERFDASRPAAHLVFLLDVSGSMDAPEKLPLVQRSLRLLVDQLGPDDRVAIVVYAGAAGVVLPSTPASERRSILDAIDRLRAGGSTAGGAGLEAAYDIAARRFEPGGINRVILCTDGDFNVGASDEGSLVRLIEERRRTGVFLSVLGFGTGNYAYERMEQLSNHGNGNAAYIDSLAEARRVLVDRLGGTLMTVARDVKIQVEFHPARVGAYRLIGYGNRLLRAQDFDDDARDAGEIGAGHSVTALYEIVPPGQAIPGPPPIGPLRYQDRPAVGDDRGDEILTVAVRYKDPEGQASRRLEFPLVDDPAAAGRPSSDFLFAASVAAFGMLLADADHRGQASFELVAELAASGLGNDEGGDRAEFLELVETARRLPEG